MHLKQLTLQNFRNYKKSTFNFSENTTLVVGPNTSGKSNLIDLQLGGGTLPPSNLAGLQGFTVPVVPEPSTIALAVMGGAGLLAIRRRK